MSNLGKSLVDISIVLYTVSWGKIYFEYLISPLGNSFKIEIQITLWKYQFKVINALIFAPEPIELSDKMLILSNLSDILYYFARESR